MGIGQPQITAWCIIAAFQLHAAEFSRANVLEIERNRAWAALDQIADVILKRRQFQLQRVIRPEYCLTIEGQTQFDGFGCFHFKRKGRCLRYRRDLG